ncbi:hypothetical protein MRB53_007798 [Persea americana]|uniref:Uncharacterized protein n=1 Tax=Persea americana TaxID=3435 RepID=A0ACC2MKA2_PERAE|nr:hypothetical protein MRB53_007798 [Persea americana]
MGCFSCFDSKEEQKLNPGKKKDYASEGKPMAESHFAKLSSGADRLKARNSAVSRKESSGPKDEAAADIKAQTFTLRELAAATNNFRPECLLGEGGFGPVYKGRLESTGQVVAVKQLDKDGLQGNREFLVEVLMLSLLHHPNLVNLIGYCASGDQRLLVYEYMALGSLEDHLLDLPPHKKPLDWNTRMKIAAGQLTVKSDVYSFGVVFLELITGRRAFDSSRVHGQQSLVAWARPMFNNRKKLPDLVDPRLEGRYPMRGLYQALAVASMCIQEEAAARPQIADVMTALSYLTSHAFDPNASSGQSIREKEERRTSSRNGPAERGGSIGRNGEGGSGSKLDLDCSRREDSPKETARMLNRDFDRERAVAEAKLWGENWREKRQANG